MTDAWDLAPALRARAEEGLYRSRALVDSPQGPEVWVDGKSYLAFCSNDYLSLANHPKVVAAFKAAADQYGVGSGAAHLISGHSREHQRLEQALAEFTGRERALLFSTGYMANIGAINALLGRGDAVFEDRLNHASLLDGGLLSGARFKRFRHSDTNHLKELLEDTEARRKLVVVDGVFSMDGDLAPLPAMADIAGRAGAWLMVDDAHGFGCLGQSGAGVTEHYGLSEENVPVLMCTLGKALGGAGAFVAGSAELIETLIQFARSYIYTTALPPAVAAAVLASLQLVRDESWRRQRLRENIQRFRRGAAELGLPLMPSDTAIQPLLLGDSSVVLAVSESLRGQGMWVGAIRPPTVPKGAARLRMTLNAGHSDEQIDRLLSALEQALNESCADWAAGAPNEKR